MKLKELLNKVGDGFDISDTVFDSGVYFDYSQDSEDYFDKVLDLMASEIEVKEYHPNWYTPCKITEYIDKHKKTFDSFLNKVYNECYTPKEVCKRLGVNEIESDSEEFYDLYIDAFENLVIGKFSEEAYEMLYNLLIKEVNA